MTRHVRHYYVNSSDLPSLVAEYGPAPFGSGVEFSNVMLASHPVGHPRVLVDVLDGGMAPRRRQRHTIARVLGRLLPRHQHHQCVAA